MTFDPAKVKAVDLIQLDLDWVAENLYANVDFTSESPGDAQRLLPDGWTLVAASCTPGAALARRC